MGRVAKPGDRLLDEKEGKRNGKRISGKMLRMWRMGTLIEVLSEDKEREERIRERGRDSRDHVGDAVKKDIPRDSVPKEKEKETGTGEDTAREKEEYPHPTVRVQ